LVPEGRSGRFHQRPQAYDRLRRIEAAIDPDNLIRSNHPSSPENR